MSETSWLIGSVVIYLMGTVAIGLYAASRVHGSKDFMVAGRSLPLYMNFACVFATWFGAETLLSISATFVNDGLTGISGDPFGAAMCLGLVAIFFARAFYRMDLLTIGDFYHKRYGKVVEVMTSLAITISYVGWTSAQMTALGLVIWVLGGDYLGTGTDGLRAAIIIGSVIVFIYTVFGGMWSVALTDVVQTAAIVVGLIVVAIILGNQAGGANKVIEAAHTAGKFKFFPVGENAAAWWTFIAAFLTFGLGSIPQQDVFQRVTSAKNERTAVMGTLLGGSFYFIFAFIPMFIAYSAIVIDHDKYAALFKSADSEVAALATTATAEEKRIAQENDENTRRKSQRVLPDLILNRTPLACKILFFGALLSAILSTASGTLLAPSSLFTENVLRPFIGHMDDKVLLWTLRVVMCFFAVTATLVAVFSTGTMYEMVQNSYKVPLTMAFVPLAAGVYWKRSTTQGALGAVLFGLVGWLTAEYLCAVEWEGITETETPWRWHLTIIPPQMYGLATSILGMIVGSLAPQFIRPAATDEATLKRSSPIVGH